MASICPNCANPLTFSPDHNALYCSKCGGLFQPEQIEAEGRDRLEDQEILSHEDVFGQTDEDAEEMADFNIYTCNNCGGEIVINSTEASTVCIYCGSPSIVFSRVSQFRKPKYIMPFRVNRQDAEGIIRSIVQQNKFIPPEIKNFQVDSIRGIYIPYYIVDVHYRDAMFLRATVGSGKHRRTVYYKRAGYVNFERLPIESSTKLSDGSSVKLEPYDLQDLVPFDEDYLTGFYSDMSDIDKFTLDKTVKARLGEMFLKEVKKSCRGSVNEVMFSHPYMHYNRTPEYCMLPVWFLTFFYENKPHTILVNGQTGKVVCGLPWVKSKVKGLIAMWTVGLSVVLSIISALLFGGGLGAGRMPFIILIISIACLFTGIAKFKAIEKAIAETQSSATFGFVKKRQG